MTSELILASGSRIRADLLTQAGVTFRVQLARVDENMVRNSLLSEQTAPRDIADALADLKAQRVSDLSFGAFVLGCDQVLEYSGKLFSKPKSPDELKSQLLSLRGQIHQLHTAVVIYQSGQPIWRFVGTVKLKMRLFSAAYMDEYVEVNWPHVCHCLGGYELEAEGVRLFSQIDGDYFTVLGLPLVEVLVFLTERGVIQK
ncbi:MAG: Maf family protein [Paracoccaceae bacterium]|nr:Maf family protein [Paracoccaceae bacterium]